MKYAFYFDEATNYTWSAKRKVTCVKIHKHVQSRALYKPCGHRTSCLYYHY